MFCKEILGPGICINVTWNTTLSQTMLQTEYMATILPNGSGPPSRKTRHATPRKLLRNGLSDMTKSSRRQPGLQTPQHAWDMPEQVQSKKAPPGNPQNARIGPVSVPQQWGLLGLDWAVTYQGIDTGSPGYRLHGWLTGLASEEFGPQADAPSSLSHSWDHSCAWPILQLPSGSALRGRTWFATEFGWVVFVKWYQEGFPSRLHFNNIINAIEFTWQWFCGWLDYTARDLVTQQYMSSNLLHVNKYN